MADYLVKEDGGRIVLEDGSGDLLLEQQAALPRTGNYLVQEPDGFSRFVLEDGSGCVLLETVAAASPVGGNIIAVAPRRLPSRPPKRHDDELIAFMLALRTRRRWRLK